MSKTIQKAIKKALKLYENHIKKGSEKTPQIFHSLETAIIISRFTNSEELITAALLHDVLEKCDYSVKELEKDFGKKISYFVVLLTEDKSINDFWDRKIEGLDRAKEYQATIMIKTVDAITEMKDIIFLIKEKREGAWQFFTGSKELRMKYYRFLLEVFKEKLPPEILVEYTEVLKDLEYSGYLLTDSNLVFSNQENQL